VPDEICGMTTVSGLPCIRGAGHPGICLPQLFTDSPQQNELLKIDLRFSVQRIVIAGIIGCVLSFQLAIDILVLIHWG
jgi:hypothetical protein